MSRTILTPLRLPEEYIKKADSMLEAFAADPEVNAVGRVTRASVLRMAIAKGLKSMEFAYAPRPKTKSSNGRRR